MLHKFPDFIQFQNLQKKKSFNKFKFLLEIVDIYKNKSSIFVLSLTLQRQITKDASIRARG
jgi:hypothetical protein